MSLDRIRQLLKQIYPIKKAFEIGEGTGNAISFALGAGTLTTIFGFIKSEPHIAMACGAIVVYYSFAVYRSVIDWFDAPEKGSASSSRMASKLRSTKDSSH